MAESESGSEKITRKFGSLEVYQDGAKSGRYTTVYEAFDPINSGFEALEVLSTEVGPVIVEQILSKWTNDGSRVVNIPARELSTIGKIEESMFCRVEEEKPFEEIEPVKL